METTTTTAPATTTTTKYYNKTKLQNSNNNNNNNHQKSTTSTTTTTHSKKTQQQQQQQTYRDLEDNKESQSQYLGVETTKKLTAKQAKQAAKLAAQQQQNVRSDTLVQQKKDISKTLILTAEKEVHLSSSTTTKPATQQTTAAATAATSIATNTTTTTANNASANVVATIHRSSSSNSNNSSGNSNKNYVNSISNSSNFNKSDNSLNNCNTTSSNNNNINKNNKNISDNQQQLQDQQQQQQQMKDPQQHQAQPLQNSPSDNYCNDNSASAWNNSKYLHKKFKRLASTTETDVLQEAEKLRTTSLSSASSSVSSPPPALAFAPAQTQIQTQQPPTSLQHQQQNHLINSLKDEALTNGYLSKQDTTTITDVATSNTALQQQVLLQLAQQQQPQQQQLAYAPVNSPSEVGVAVSSSSAGSNMGRYICPYCNLSCTKPSVLQKHIRAHTNERPYPCDICGIAFKTKSNLYKHCRSRSHAARQKGIEIPPDADDGLSDQDVDPELSNSSSDVLSRTDSPMEDISNNSALHHNAEQYTIIPTPLNSSSSAASPLPPPLPATKSVYLQQPLSQHNQQLQQQPLPLGSPAAGTLPPATASIAPNSSGSSCSSIGNNSSLTAAHKQAIDYKPYKPKFHNASMYSSPKEAAAAAAAAHAAAASNAAIHSPVPIKETVSQQQQQQPATQKPTPELHVSINQQQQLMEAQKLAAVQSSAAVSAHLPPQPSPTHMSHHHPSLSPSTQMKLNNHISTHQLQQLQQQQLQQQQLQQLQPQAPHHLLGPPPQANPMTLPIAAAAYYLGQPPPGTPAALLHPSAHLPAQSFYNPVAFAPLHLMTPQQQQQFHHQLQLQQQHLQQQQHQLQQLQHSSVILQQAPPQSPVHTQPPAPPPPASAPAQTHVKAPTPVGNVSQSASGNTRASQHPKSSTPSNIIHPSIQNPLHYLANAASAASALNSQPLTVNSKAADMGEQHAANLGQRSNNPSMGNTNLLQTTSSNSGMGEVTLNKEKLHEHINKIISQNEAIVENKELLLQKKYPKTLNRSRSFNNPNSGSNSNSSTTSQSLPNTTGGPPSESATNAKLAQVIVQKQQQQLQQQQQQYLYQQHQQQQQQHHHHQQQQQQQHQQQQLLKQRHIYSEKSNMEELPQPLNGTSKHLVGKLMQSQTSPTPIQPHLTLQINPPASVHQYRSIVTNNPQSQLTPSALSQTSNSVNNTAAMSNVPLNLSAKPKSSVAAEEHLDLSIKQPLGPMPQQPPPATPRKRHSIEQQQPSSTANFNEASNSSNSSPQPPQPSTSAGKYPPNNSIIKNLLLNARGLAVPMGEGDDAVYKCPLCSMDFRTAEDLQLHNSTYCQGSSSSANSPASSPSHKYFRSSSISLNMSDLKILSKNPLSLAKLAWSQLKTKQSNLVLNRLSASLANTSKSSGTSTTSTSTQSHSSSTTHASTASTAGPSMSNISVAVTKSQLTLNEIPLRFVDAPLPSPGPLLGKTPLVDYTTNESKHKSEEVIITKMHDDRMYNLSDHTAGKRLKFDSMEKFASKRLSNITSGGDMQLLNAQELNKKDERIKRFTSSGGCMIPLSECDDVDKSPKMIRTPLLSGGSFQEVSPKKESKLPLTLTPKLNLGLSTSTAPQHFQFPPINQITAFNPLTLPLTEKVIPYVPGIPGPNSLTHQLTLLPPTVSATQQHLQLPQNTNQTSRTVSPNRKQSVSPMNTSSAPGPVMEQGYNKTVSTFGGVQNVPSEFARAPPSANMRNVRNWNSNVNNISNKIPAVGETKSLKSFNFLRMADNLSPRKVADSPKQPTDAETRHFNLERVAKDQLIIQQPLISNKALSPSSSSLTPLHVDINTSPTAGETDTAIVESKAKSKFLRPTSLPLRPGTFTPKRHHGITPTANTLPLISPETPRPSKECVQLYLNGNSYTYLGLKSSTKPFYCTLNCPQPSYVQDMHKLSMYSMWQQCAENNPHPLGFKPKEVMSLYDSRQKMLVFTMAEEKKLSFTLVTAQQTVMTPFLSSQDKIYHHQLKPISITEANSPKEGRTMSDSKDSSKDLMNLSSPTTSQSATLVGGYESHENYTYIRGRGRGKYVCSECGIRCKKPSMLKKHIRTHTDVRPYTCKHCNFSFKTKGNLTKHMQSKTHYKKCIELGLNPGPMPADGEFLEPDMEFDQQSSTSAGGRTSSMGNAESDSDGDSSDNETESSNESDSARSNNMMPQMMNMNAGEDNKSHLEHEAARCLLSLSMTPPIHTQTSEALSQIVFTTAVSSSVTATPTPAIRRVISYTSPKPPFDYQKQEQYYSNPEESKPKNLNSATTNYETTPMDLTKPRHNESDTAHVSYCSTSPNISPSHHASLASLPGPVQTQAQIRDVIFGGNSNESGLLKTMISVSSKVGRSQQGISEEVRHLNEDMMLYDYRREQILKYYNLKQTQTRSSSANETLTASSPSHHSIITTTVTQSSTMIAVTAVSSSYATTSVISAVITTPDVKKDVPIMQLPKIEIIEAAVETKKPEAVVHPIVADEVQKTHKSSDESEETDEEPPAKKSLTNNDDKPAHNSNLPAAILQPGTTDFSGVLSGGGNGSASQPTRTVIVGEDGFTTNNNEILPVHPRVPQITNSDGRPVCSICSKTFQKQSQLVLHMNIHYMERKYKCDPCGVSFRTQGHLQKHERSEAHKNKVIMTSTFGVPTTSNPRPFECTDCKIAFRIHGHLAKHLRSKTHVQKLECLQKLPFGTYAEIERAGISLTEIDTSDCENSLISLRVLAQKLIEKDPSSKLGSYTTPSGVQDNNSNTGLVSQDSASEDGFQAAASAAASAIASLDNDSAANTPRRANSMSEDESISLALNNNLKRRLPGTFSNGEESDKEFQEIQEKRLRQDISNNHMNSASPTAN